ncbi:MAG: 1-acyl-sn-glycerol-3-phosphate acyltransferase [Petrimonas sp.]|nr:1-acyl-sn-glycerol-3-phosphate acyltransferase [Petrimonas sp.]
MKYEYSKGYRVVQFFVNTAMRLHYRKIVFSGLSNISPEKPVIFAPNHRNAVIDPLLVVFKNIKRQVVFLARADVFRKKMIADLLIWFHIMPVYRMRDGRDNLENNNDTFETSSLLLKKRIPLALFPEGRHNPKQSLLPLQKAIPRIVLPTEAEENFTLKSEIIPTAIYYPDLFGFLSDVYVTYGEPIKVADYKNLYAENPVAAANRMRQEMESRMKQMVVNVWNDEFYNEYMLCIDLNAKKTAKEQFSGKKDGYLQAALHIVHKLDDLFAHNREVFDKKMAGYREAIQIMTEHGLKSKDEIHKPSSPLALLVQLLLLVISFPVAAFGFVNGILPIVAYKRLLGAFKDNQFIPTVRLVSGLIFVPVFGFLQALLIGIFTQNWLLSLIYLAVMPVTFYFAVWWRKWGKSLKRKWKVTRFKKSFPREWKKLLSLVEL